MSNIDSLFSQIQELGNTETKTSKRSNKPKTEFKNVDNAFLNGVLGNYELRVLTDSEGKITEEVHLHTIKTKTDRVTVVCKGEECEICKLQKQLEDAGYGNSWKFRKYSLNKLLVKVGEIPDSSVTSIVPGGTYVAYVDGKFFKPLMNSISSNKKYYEQDLVKMLTKPAEESGGFIVSAAKNGKTTAYQFNFIPTMKINPVDFKEVTGIDNPKLSNLGMFRTNYVNPTKLEKAVGILRTILINHASSKNPDTPVESTTPDETATLKNDDSNQESVSTELESVKQEVVEHVPESTPTTETLSSIPVVTESESDGNPPCFGNFDPAKDECSVCEQKKPCLMNAMENGRI